MNLAPGCHECLSRLIYQAAELATNDVSLRQSAINEAMKILDYEFSYSQLSIVIATKIHKVVRKVTHHPDLYWIMKERAMTLARLLYSELSLQTEASSLRRGKKRDSLYSDELQSYLKLAVAANAIDFFREPGSIKEDIKKNVSFTADNSEQFESKLKDACKVLYLADNAREFHIDLPLAK